MFIYGRFYGMKWQPLGNTAKYKLGEFEMGISEEERTWNEKGKSWKKEIRGYWKIRT